MCMFSLPHDVQAPYVQWITPTFGPEAGLTSLSIRGGYFGSQNASFNLTFTVFDDQEAFSTPFTIIYRYKSYVVYTYSTSFKDYMYIERQY